MIKEWLLSIAVKKAATRFVQVMIAQLPFVMGWLDKVGVKADIKIDEAVLVATIVAGIEVLRNYLKHKK
ncbi:MAG: hypothetical protein ACHQ1D_00755 [Nitrososphaerales archaeon]